MKSATLAQVQPHLLLTPLKEGKAAVVQVAEAAVEAARHLAVLELEQVEAREQVLVQEELGEGGDKLVKEPEAETQPVLKAKLLVKKLPVELKQANKKLLALM